MASAKAKPRSTYLPGTVVPAANTFGQVLPILALNSSQA